MYIYTIIIKLLLLYILLLLLLLFIVYHHVYLCMWVYLGLNLRFMANTKGYKEVIVPFPIASLCGLRALEHLAAENTTPMVEPRPCFSMFFLRNHLSFGAENTLFHRF